MLSRFVRPARHPHQSWQHGGTRNRRRVGIGNGKARASPARWTGAQTGELPACLARRGLQGGPGWRRSARGRCRGRAKRVTCYVTCSVHAGTRSGGVAGPAAAGRARFADAALFPAHDTRYVTRNAPRSPCQRAGGPRGASRGHRAGRMPQGFAGTTPDFGGVCAVARQTAGIPIAPSPSPPHAADKRVARPSD
ncbi:protein of unknown function (plasmid) [Cupriavidus taiwanensis]|uniref:Uncharacterized protein n=1 Tax=Cupriavidus taiwanensis TaxID=164546 RepID=A0A9Q7XTM2_9BURK|nr:protein of unknown function [Cupriavidus taiwanensis]